MRKWGQTREIKVLSWPERICSIVRPCCCVQIWPQSSWQAARQTLFQRIWWPAPLRQRCIRDRKRKQRECSSDVMTTKDGGCWGLWVIPQTPEQLSEGALAYSSCWWWENPDSCKVNMYHLSDILKRERSDYFSTIYVTYHTSISTFGIVRWIYLHSCLSAWLQQRSSTWLDGCNATERRGLKEKREPASL